MNVGIFLIFRAFSHYNIPTFQAIVVNYLVCVLTGILFLGHVDFVPHLSLDQPWVIIAIGLGAVFIGTFYLMALATQRLGVTVSSIASKMSLVIPVVISLFVLNIASRELIVFNYIGIVLALVAILLSSIKKKRHNDVKIGIFTLLMPALVFIFGGVIDTSINYTSHKYLGADNEAVFPIVIFFTALCIGLVILFIKRPKLNAKSLLGGALLGIINYFSIYFLVKSLGAFGNDGAIVYPVINVGIILISSFSSVLIFKERLSNLNKLGLTMSIVAVLLIFYQEISAQF
jgi:drug/metabolite transporter (DMT)-like permease